MSRDDGRVTGQDFEAGYATKAAMLRVLAAHRLPAAALRVAIVLLHRANLETGRCNPGRATIIKDLGGDLTEDAVRRAIQDLRAIKMLEVEYPKADGKSHAVYVWKWDRAAPILADKFASPDNFLPPENRRPPRKSTGGRKSDGTENSPDTPSEFSGNSPKIFDPGPSEFSGLSRESEEGKEGANRKGVAVAGDAPAPSDRRALEARLRRALNAHVGGGFQARVARAMGVRPKRVSNFGKGAAVEFTIAQLAAGVAAAEVTSVPHRPAAEAERSFPTSNLENLHA